jgi:hypothetical protein
MRSIIRQILLWSAVSLVLPGCEEKLDLATLPQPVESTIDTSYVEVDPPFPGFPGAEDILIGRDQLLYVADTRANRVVMMNRGGQVLSTRDIMHPRSMSQDTRLDLLVGGEIVVASGDTAGAIFRLKLVSLSADSAHHLEVARMETVWVEIERPRRRFPGLTAFDDNTWLAVRTGPDNSSFIDPDARVLQFSAADRFITPVPSFYTRPGSGITDIYQPTAIASFPSSRDFILTQAVEAVAYGALWMRYEDVPEFQGWLPRFDPANPQDRSVDFIVPYRYLLPEAVAIDPGRRDVFVADAQLDSVFKFTSRGRFKSESFGSVRTAGVMRRPTGLAYFEKMLYVLDSETGNILRYRLSTDVPR